ASVHISRSNAMTGDKPADVSIQVKIENLSDVDARDAQVILAVTENNLASNVTKGENEGHRLLHSSVVRNMSIIGEVAGKTEFAATTLISVNKTWKLENLRD